MNAEEIVARVVAMYATTPRYTDTGEMVVMSEAHPRVCFEIDVGDL